MTHGVAAMEGDGDGHVHVSYEYVPSGKSAAGYAGLTELQLRYVLPLFSIWPVLCCMFVLHWIWQCDTYICVLTQTALLQ